MSWKLFDPCNPCCDCTIKEWDAPTIAAGEYIETDLINNVGYRITAYLDVELSYSHPTYNIIGDPDDYAGLQLQIVDSGGTVLQYAELGTAYQFYFGQQFTPLVQEADQNNGNSVYARIGVCNDSVQFRSSYDTYGFVDAAGKLHSHNGDSNSYSTVATMPHEHNQAVKLRLTNNSAYSMTFLSVIAERIIDTEQVDFDSTGCPTSAAVITNDDCTADTLCSLLDGNRVHQFTITDHNLPVTLNDSLTTGEFDGCGSEFTYGPYHDGAGVPVIQGTATTVSTGSPQCYTWTIDAIYEASYFVRNVNNYRLTVEPYHTLIDDCTVRLTVTLVLNYAIVPQLGYPTITPPTYSYPVKSYTTFNMTGAGSYMFATDVLRAESLGWTVDVPRWNATTTPVRLMLADAVAPANIPLVTDFVFTDNLTNCPDINGNYGTVSIELALTEIMNSGSYIEITGT